MYISSLALCCLCMSVSFVGFFSIGSKILHHRAQSYICVFLPLIPSYGVYVYTISCVCLCVCLPSYVACVIHVSELFKHVLSIIQYHSSFPPMYVCVYVLHT